MFYKKIVLFSFGIFLIFSFFNLKKEEKVILKNDYSVTINSKNELQDNTIEELNINFQYANVNNAYLFDLDQNGHFQKFSISFLQLEKEINQITISFEDQFIVLSYDQLIQNENVIDLTPLTNLFLEDNTDSQIEIKLEYLDGYSENATFISYKTTPKPYIYDLKEEEVTKTSVLFSFVVYNNNSDISDLELIFLSKSYPIDIIFGNNEQKYTYQFDNLEPNQSYSINIRLKWHCSYAPDETIEQKMIIETEKEKTDSEKNLLIILSSISILFLLIIIILVFLIFLRHKKKLKLK